MRAFVATLCAVAILALTPAVGSAQVEQIVCGRLMGYSAATTTEPGSFVLVERHHTAPEGNYVVIPAGMQVSFPEPGFYTCARTTVSGSTRTFVEFLEPGSPGYRAEPTSSPAPTEPGGVGPLPSTSTDPSGAPLIAALVAALAALAGLWLRARDRGHREG